MLYKGLEAKIIIKRIESDNLRYWNSNKIEELILSKLNSDEEDLVRHNGYIINLIEFDIINDNNNYYMKIVKIVYEIKKIKKEKSL
jgi:hypothetical protein